MDAEMTHERCSELLGDYARGSLQAPEGAEVERHLASCDDCAAELAALHVLSAPAGPPLSEHERARLERGVAWELGDLVVARPPRSRLAVRLAQGLGAAALLAIAGIALLQGLTGTSSNEGAAAGGGGNAATAPNRNQKGVPAAEGAAGGTADAALAPAPAPSFDRHAGTLSTKMLDRLGEKSARFVGFSQAYSASDAKRLKVRYTRALVTQASGAIGTTASDTVQTCVDKVYESTATYSLLPAYGADATVEGRDALVLGFVWSAESTGPLDQYMFWVFPTSSCETPIDYRAGHIHK